MSISVEFKSELTVLLNKFSVDNDVGKPDYVLAAYLVNHLKSLQTLKMHEDLNKALENGDFYAYVEPNWE